MNPRSTPRRVSIAVAGACLLAGALLAPPAAALEEADRLWFVGQRALADRMTPFAVQTLDQFVKNHPGDARVPQALMTLGQARLSLGDREGALDAFRRAQKTTPPGGAPYEARFWEAEMLFQLTRYADASAAYRDVVTHAATAPFAPEAFYSYGWTEARLGRPDAAVSAFERFLASWPDHTLASSATYQLGRVLVEQKRHADAVTPLATFLAKYPDHKLAPDVRYMLGFARVASGDGTTGLADLKAFVSRHPAHPLAADARKLVTDVSVRVGDKDDLAHAYAALMKETPATAETLLTAASVAARLGRTRDQEAAWRKLAAEFPDHPMTSKLAFDLANAAFTRREYALAATFAQAAARTDDDAVKAEAFLLAGESEMKLKRFASAAKAFEAVGAVRNVDGALRYRALAELGVAREGQKDLRAALTAYEAVAKHSPDPALRDWARERAEALKARVEQAPATAPTTKRTSS